MAKEESNVQHTAGGATTREDLDGGVPMLPGDPKEPQGPEDALGVGKKRGDYRNRLGEYAYEPHVSVPIPDAKPGEPTAKLVPQAPRAENIGDEKAKKGGVTT
jgi:hypothetical protein